MSPLFFELQGCQSGCQKSCSLYLSCARITGILSAVTNSGTQFQKGISSEFWIPSRNVIIIIKLPPCIHLLSKSSEKGVTETVYEGHVRPFSIPQLDSRSRSLQSVFSGNPNLNLHLSNITCRMYTRSYPSFTTSPNSQRAIIPLFLQCS